VLNKFAIVPAHFILATKEFKPQTALLEETDLEAAWGCLKAWRMIATDGERIGEESRDEGEGLFAFFNSGACSGASQPHRHIQLLPVEMMRECLQSEDGGEPEWGVLADRLVGEHALDLPFKYFAKPLPQNPTARQLHSLYIELYERACGLVGEYVTMHPDEDRLLSDGRDGECVISYNLGLTDSAMVLCPRRAEGSFISDGIAGNLNTGSVSLNGTILAGTLLVKNETEWNILKNDVSQLTKILGAIGIPSLVSTDEML
jgi:sulfate adenylyltransferase (ADP) / ATP adenylyltransferase